MMSSRIRVAIAFMICVCVLAGCAAPNREAQNLGQVSGPITIGQTHTDFEGVEVRIANAVWNEEGMTLAVKWINHTNYEVIYGASYTIERLEDGEWVSCATVDDLVFIAIAYVLRPGQVNNETYKVSGMFDVSKAGTYRFRSDFSVDADADETSHLDLWAEFEIGSDLDQNQIVPAETRVNGVQYIRTDGYRDGAEFPRVEIIRSVEELDSYYEANKGFFDLERNPDPASDSTLGFLDACDEYDAAYFEDNYLVFVLLEEGSGSIRHEVTETTISSDGELTVFIDTITPEIGTCDMAEWHIILEMSRKVEVADADDVLVYLNGKLASGTEGKIEEPYISYADAIFKAPPALRLVSEGVTAPVNLGTHSWSYDLGDGTSAGVCCDHAHPLDCKKYVTPIELYQRAAWLAFEDDPDSVTIHCWPDSKWGQTQAESEPVEFDGLSLELRPGGYIYEVIAKWDDNGASYYGTAYYYFYAIVDEGHAHRVARQPQTVDDPISGYCGNTRTTLYIGNEAYTFMYDESVTLTDILINLDYDEDKLCKCRTEYTVDTEFGRGYGISLSQGFVRHEKGQADLTQDQIDRITEIIEWARKEKPGV